MVRRHRRSGFAAAMWVFPGGVVDEVDRHLDPACWSGAEIDVLATRLRTSPGEALGLHVAAVRETFEEANLLLATHADGAPVDLDEPAVRALRGALIDRASQIGAADFAEWLRASGYVLDFGALAYFSHWITPRIEPKRYDTRFFLAVAPEGQVAEHDQVEITEQRWMTPRAVLNAAAEGEMAMLPPTLSCLEWIDRLQAPDVDTVLGRARAVEEVPTVLPHFERLPDGDWRILLPTDDEYPYDDYRDELEPQDRPA